MLGALLGLLSAATFAFNNAAVRRGVLSGSVAQAMAITVPVGLPIFLIGVILMDAFAPLGEFTLATWFWLSLAGVQHFILGRYCNYRATKAMGAVLTGPVQQSGLIFTLAIAVLALGEQLTPLRILGIILVIGGPALSLHDGLSKTKAKRPKREVSGAGNDETVIKVAANAAASKPAFEPNYVEGYTHALISALAQGTSPILVRFALGDKGLGASVAGGLISYGAATLVFCLFLFWPGQWRHVVSVNREAAKWFTISGLFVGVSQLFRYMALAVAPVSVVTPIQRLSLLFRVYFARLMSRDHEVLEGKVIFGTVVSLVGTLALSISTEVVLEYVPLPDWLVTVARWSWP
ncbi:MAG TPA: EamA family transporter [Alphaproteobacteria bacterium]|nr:EamA family transporter [Alphaproteobacteria bacterium]